MSLECLDHLRRFIGPEKEHADIAYDRYITSCGYRACDWVAFKMGGQKTESQTMSLFHGTSAQSAIGIHLDGFFVYETSSHGGKTGLFGQGDLMDGLQYAKRHPPDVDPCNYLEWKNCPMVVEYRCDPDLDHICPRDKVHKGKCLQTYNKTAVNRGSMYVWRHPTNMYILGFGDGLVLDPDEDQLGISSVWLHVHKEIFSNYCSLPSVWNAIREGSLFLCRGRYTQTQSGHVDDICPEWTCGKVSFHARDWQTTRKTRRKLICPRCFELGVR